MAPSDRYPPQTKYILGNEACERFSFYGMKNILTVFFVNYLLVSLVEDEAARKEAGKSTYHLFNSAVYFFPLVGGYVADRFLGKYRTILSFSIVYCLGHAALALFEKHPAGFYAGLGLIAFGSGGIKPCVSAFVGDQFDESNKHLVKRVFGAFYWLINFGSFFASLLTPWVLKAYGPAYAFGLPGVLMAVATLIFWLGRHQYTDVPPTGHNPHGFGSVVASALTAKDPQGRKGLDRALAAHPPEAVDAVRAVFAVVPLFLPLAFFWALFDQKGSTWVLQAEQMDRVVWGFKVEASQMLMLNPLLVMLLVPLMQGLLYPWAERQGIPLTPIRRITAGMVVAGVSFLLVAALESVLLSGGKPNIAWQAGPYAVLTLAEVLVSTTALEFAYSQAPTQMKSVVMSLYNLSVTLGNLVTAAVAGSKGLDPVWRTLFFAALAFFGAVAFWWMSRGYVVRDRFQAAPAA
jgi:POT family proton-dependent oligopeptide transporter